MHQDSAKPSIYNEALIDFRELKESRKLIIKSILFFATLATIYSVFMLKPSFYSHTIIEIGYSDSIGEKVLIENPKVLRDELKVNFIHKNLDQNLLKKNIKFTILDNNLILVDLTSNSAEINKRFLSNLISYSVNRHNKISKINLTHSINEINIQIEEIDLELPLIEEEIKQLEIFQSLEKDRVSVITRINDLQRIKNERSLRKKILETKLENLKSSDFFETQSIEGIETITIKPRRMLIISLGVVFGFFVSFVLIFFRNFMRALKEY